MTTFRFDVFRTNGCKWLKTMPGLCCDIIWDFFLKWSKWPPNHPWNLAHVARRVLTLHQDTMAAGEPSRYQSHSTQLFPTSALKWSLKIKQSNSVLHSNLTVRCVFPWFFLWQTETQNQTVRPTSFRNFIIAVTAWAHKIASATNNAVTWEFIHPAYKATT